MIMNRKLTGKKWLLRSLLVVAGLWFAAACVYQIGSPWLWGHDGFTGATFTQAARNSLRFGIVAQAPFHRGFEPPSPDVYYTHHPMLLHAQLVAMYSLFGFQEWAGRLPSAIYAFGTWVLLFVLVRRFRDESTAVVACCLYASIPLQLSFPNMVNHEQGGLFWIMALLYAYLRWHESQQRIFAALALLFVSLAAQYDWPGYYIAFFIALHASGAALGATQRSRDARVWRDPHARFVGVFSLVVLANFFGFFAWIASVRGGLDDMVQAFKTRTSAWENFTKLQWEQLLDLQGPIVVALCGAWLAAALVRWVRQLRSIPSGCHAIDFAVVSLLCAQLIHTYAFKNAAAIHCFWTYFLGAPLAIAGAQVLVDGARWLSLGLDRVPGMAPSLRWAISALAVGGVCGSQWQFGMQKMQEVVHSGHGAMRSGYYDQYAELHWIKQVRAGYPRPTAIFLPHASIYERRSEFSVYLDAPITGSIARLRRIHQHARSGAFSQIRHRVVLFDLHRVQKDPRFIREVRALRNKHPVVVWDRRFVSMDIAMTGARLDARRLEPLPEPWWWSWLVMKHHKPTAWVPDPDVRKARRALNRYLR